MTNKSGGSDGGSGGEGPRLDHVGVLVRDLEAASAHWESRFGLPVASTFEAPSLNIRAAFLALPTSTIELYTIDEPTALQRALGGASAKIDHLALRFGDELEELDLRGCALRGPGRPDRIVEPFRIAGSDHVWTEPPGIDVLLQLITPAATRG
jgi:catechol 2,3-dioxygenase-like lactoylglutathione lyase family enzyme